MAAPKKKASKAPKTTAKAVKPVKAAKGKPGAAKPKAKRPWLVPLVMVAVMLGVGAQIYLKSRYLASLKFDMIRVGRVVPHGSDEGQAKSVLSVVADKAGQVFLMEDAGAASRLQRFDPMLGANALVYKPATPEQKVEDAADMDVSPAGLVYVLLKDGRVVVVSNDLKFLRSYRTGVQGASAITVNEGGRAYIASSVENKVAFFDEKGNREGEFGAPGTGTGDLVNPGRMRMTADGEIVVIERTEGGLRCKVFKADHTLRKTFLVENIKNCDPVKLGVTGDGKAFLNDHLGSRGIIAYDVKTGKFFGESQTTKDGQKFISPGALGASRFSNTVFVHSVAGLMECRVPGSEDPSTGEEQ